MVSRSAKAAYYWLLGGPMWVNGRVFKSFRAPTAGTVKVQLGPGQNNYLPGWVNVDANLISARRDVWADLRNPLPFRDGTVDAFYSHHVIEHLPDTGLAGHFREMFRCLKPGGVFRVGGPNGDEAVKRLVAGDAAWFPDWPDRRSSVGGRFVNFVFIRNEHLTMLTASYLAELAAAAGFVGGRTVRPAAETGFPQWFDAAVLGKETAEPPGTEHTIMFEAVKPGGPTDG